MVSGRKCRQEVISADPATVVILRNNKVTDLIKDYALFGKADSL